MPKPWQVAHAPEGLLKLKRRGSVRRNGAVVFAFEAFRELQYERLGFGCSTSAAP